MRRIPARAIVVAAVTAALTSACMAGQGPPGGGTGGTAADGPGPAPGRGPVVQAVPASSRVAEVVAAAPTDRMVLAAGDIGDCSSSGDEATAAIIARYPSALVLPLGDLAYPNGTAAEFASCYHPTWGDYYWRTRPVPGNHEYRTAGASAYFSYFGSAKAGAPDKGYYSYNLGTWHMVALNSNCEQVGGCGPGSPQEQWLRADLAAHRARCTLAYSHYPVYSSGLHGPKSEMSHLFAILHAANVDVVLSGHDHGYERFGLQGLGGMPDPHGVRQFVVGTGGASTRPFGGPQSGSIVRASVLGVLQLNLRSGRYDWRFLPAAGYTFTEAVASPCL